jgi:hypothetical protein
MSKHVATRGANREYLEVVPLFDEQRQEVIGERVRSTTCAACWMDIVVSSCIGICGSR